ncbi:MAG: AraC family transcriptional regulator [Gammaproteobacteria bacterium]
MVEGKKAEAAVTETADGSHAMVRVDALRMFPEVVSRLGGDPSALLSKVQIDPASLGNRHAVIPYRAVVRLLERAAAELGCPDFGMRLAAAQGGFKILGPLQYAMRNSRTLREAFRYGVEHNHVYSTGTQLHYEEHRVEGAVLLRIELLLPRKPSHLQTMERSLLLTQHSALSISGGRARAREVWFTHAPISPLSTYEAHFGAPVRFGQRMNGLLFSEQDLDLPIADADPQVYELATSYIEDHFPAADAPLSARIKAIVERLLLAGNCTYSGVASMLGMHPRTLQRRLQAEGESFESIKDSVRRDIALRYLKQPSVPLIQIARMLGYSETSALSRSCYRWFSASPRQMRSGRDVEM